MELYIDNKKVKLKPKKYKSFGTAVNDIRNHLQKDKKIPYKFYVNGEKLKENDIVNIEDLKLLEVITRSESEMLLDSLLKAKEQIDLFFQIFEETEDEEEPFVLNEIELLERGIFLRWFYNLLLIIKASGDLEFVYEDFDEYIKDFEREMKSAEEAFDSKDYETFVEILEFSISDLLNDFYENVENYFEDIAAEENRKRLLN